MEVDQVADSKVPLSKEENDILHRDAKKIRNDEGKLHGEEWPKLGTEGVGRGANEVSTEQAAVLGQEMATTEEWKVVQRPRRQKKSGKDAKQTDVRRKEEGSRFGVLADEGNGGVREQIVTDQVAVPEVAVEVNPPRQPTSAQLIREKKAETKKKLKKEQLQVRYKGVQKQSKQDLRKEKRAREMAQGEQLSKGILSLTGGERREQVEDVLQKKEDLQKLEEDKGVQRSEVGPMVENVSDPNIGPDLGPNWEQLVEGCLDDGKAVSKSGPIGEGGPIGKFWAAPLSADSDLDLVLDEPTCDGMDTMVQDTQF
ncbi:hypothetical protein K1719_022016 [Acacia pycnantha]|nr:hypothetical protein K1719_022016 [Acacia pycnantha]